MGKNEMIRDKEITKDKGIFSSVKLIVRNLLLLLCAAVLVEICFFNFRSIQSLFYEEHSWEEYTVEYSGVNRYDGGLISIQDDYATIAIQDIGLDVKNIRLELELLDSIDLFYMESGVCYVDILVCDEGNGNVLYHLIEDWPIQPENLTSQFKWMQTMGKTQRLDIHLELPAGHLLKVNGITLNAKKPLDFSVVRFVMIWLVLQLCYGLRRQSEWWKEDCKQVTIGKKAVLGFVFLVFYGISLYLMISNPTVMNDDYNPYQELAWALDAGQASLLEQPPQELVSMENPYSFWEKYALDLDYKYDFAYYNGNYYVYHGILPCLLFYLPIYHLTGLNMPNSIPVFFCCLLFGIGLVLLARQIIIRYFPKTPFAMLVLIALTGLFSCQLPFFITQADSYILTLISAVALVVWGLYFWISAKRIEESGYSKGRIIAGSFCMALVAATRPTLLLYSVLAFVIFGRAWLTGREGYEKKDRITMMVLFAVPYVAVAIPVMYYNAIRFGSPLEFGMKYNLTTFDIRHLRFSLDQIYYAVGEYLFHTPDFNYFFPFISTFETYTNRNAHSIIDIEGTFHAGLISVNIFLLAFLVIIEKRKEFKKKGLYSFCVCLSLIGLLLMMLDVALTNAVIYRYQADFMFALFITAWVGILWMQEQYGGKDSHRVFQKILLTVVFLSVAVNALFWFTPFKFPMASGNTQLYYDIYYGFNFW
ncbi:MAG: hypothetical protein K2J95_05395 [Lachnospiraceae bacterium]|nr:hypothetical protein [Lachnospiraceae bacterium]